MPTSAWFTYKCAVILTTFCLWSSWIPTSSIHKKKPRLQLLFSSKKKEESDFYNCRAVGTTMFDHAIVWISFDARRKAESRQCSYVNSSHNIKLSNFVFELFQLHAGRYQMWENGKLSPTNVPLTPLGVSHSPFKFVASCSFLLVLPTEHPLLTY